MDRLPRRQRRHVPKALHGHVPIVFKFLLACCRLYWRSATSSCLPS